MSNYLNHKIFFIIIIFLSIIKILYSFYFGDIQLVDEWSILYENLVNSNGYSYYEINGQKLPSAYMPPLYPYFLYVFSYLDLTEFYTVKLILLSQCIFSFFSVIIFYKILINYFEKKTSYFVSVIYFIYPLNFYASSQISSVSLQVFLFLLFCFYFIKLSSLSDYILLGIVAGLSILIRGEFWLLFFLLIFLKLILKKLNSKKFFISIIMVCLIISPQIVHNYNNFQKIVITQSSGYNLWRGNSEIPNINGETSPDNKLKIKIEKLKNELIYEKDLNNYEIYLDKIYLDRAVMNIANDPYKYLKHYISKFFSFAFFNLKSNYPGYYNPLSILPEILISVFAVAGIVINIISKKRNDEFLFITIYYLGLIPVFFILPRYKLFILPMYFIFATYFFAFLSEKNFFKKAIK